MNIQPRLLDVPPAAPAAAAPSGAGGDDFRAAFARAVDAGAGSRVVRAGDTLSGLARAELTAAGRPATPAAIAARVRELAQANRLQNPDRIYAGQTLALPRLAADARAAAPPAAPDIAGGPAVDAGRSRAWQALHALDWQSRPPDEGGGREFAPAALAPVASAPPPPVAARLDGDEELCAGAEGVAALRPELAAYAENAGVAARGTGVASDVLYKGVVGKVLDAVPLEPATRTALQQTNAVVSNSFTGRSLAALTGIGGPILTFAGLVWGLFSSQQIQTAQTAEPRRTAQSKPDALAN